LKVKENDMKRHAWYTWLASTNRPIFGQTEFEFKSFDELFPPESAPVPIGKTPEELTAECEKLGLKPPIF
jgi:hypothetical protein